MCAPRGAWQRRSSPTHVLAPAASPAVGTRWLETLEATLRPPPSEAYQEAPQRGYPGLRSRSQIEAETRGTQLLLQTQASFRQVANGWRALGRADRVEAMIQRWRPQALAEARAARTAAARGGVVQTPYAGQLSRLLLDLGRENEARVIGVLGPDDWIRHDLASGRGLDRLDAHLAATDANRVSAALITCWYEAVDRKRFADARTCWVRYAALDGSPTQEALAAEAALRIGGSAARAGHAATARDMLDRGLAQARAVPWAHPDLAVSSNPPSFDLLEIVKAELRAGGRLPPRVA